MSNCRETPKNNKCAATTSNNTGSVNQCDGTSVCLSFGTSLVYDGNCWKVSGTPTVSDGWYDRVHVVNGCIVDADISPLPVYVPPPCAPTGSGGGGGGDTCGPLSPDPANLLVCNGTDLLGKLYFGTQVGLTVSGYGTATSPLEFTVTSQAQQTYINTSTPDAISLTGSGTLADAYIIGLKTSPLAAGTYNGITFDAYGKAIAASSIDGLTALTNGVGTTASVVAGVGKVDLANTGVTAGNYLLGGYTVSYNLQGQATSIGQTISIDAGTYTLGSWDVTVNAQGSITDIEAAVIPPAELLNGEFVRYFPAPAIATIEEYSVTIDLQVASALCITYTSGDDSIAESGSAEAMRAVVYVNSAAVATQRNFVSGYVEGGESHRTMAVTKAITGVIPAGSVEITIANRDGQYLLPIASILEIALVAVIP